MHLVALHPWWIVASATVLVGVVTLGYREVVDRKRRRLPNINSLIQTTELKGFEPK
jgi:hypothetical protein